MRCRKKVALLIESSNGYARELLQGIRTWQQEHGAWAIRLSEHARGTPVPDWLCRWRGDGVIARIENPRIATALKLTRMPVVDVSAALERPVFPRVASDSEAICQLAIEHFREQGFRHFAYCGDTRFLWSVRRSGFFRNQVRARGGAFSAYGEASGLRPAAAEAEIAAIAKWLKTLPKPVGVFACYDVRGHQVLEACKLARLEVPLEVGVLGVHNDELLCELCDPPLSSIIPNARRAGYEAAALLAQMMAGNARPPAVQLILPLGVAARQSTDVVAIKDEPVAAAARYIREHAMQGIQVKDVLRAVPMSRTLLERRFRGVFGRSPGAYISKVRIEGVKTLLATSALAVCEIADRAGFEHAEYLSVAFRRATGMTPSQYRARHHTRRD